MTTQREKETMSAEDPRVEDLIVKLSILLHRREVTLEEIYDALMAVNDNNEKVAVFVRDKALLLAESYNTQMCSLLN